MNFSTLPRSIVKSSLVVGTLLLLSALETPLSAQSESIVNILQKARTTPIDAARANSYFEKAKAFKMQKDSSIYYYEKARVVYERKGALDRLVACYAGLGYKMVHTGNPKDYPFGFDYLHKAIAMGLRLLGEPHAVIADTYQFLGIGYWAHAEYEKAIQAHEKSLAMRQELYGESHPDVAESYYYLGKANGWSGYHEEAIQHTLTALAIQLEVSGEHDFALFYTYNNLGNFYAVTGDHATAIDYFKKSIAIARHNRGENANYLMPLTNMADAYRSLGDYDRALDLYEISLAWRIKRGGKDDFVLIYNYDSLGNLHHEQGNFDKALEYHNEGLRIILRSYDKPHEETAKFYQRIGREYLAKRNYGAALSNLLKSLQMNLAGSYYARYRDYLYIGQVHESLGDFGQALDNYQSSIISLVPGFSDRDIYVNPAIDMIRLNERPVEVLSAKAEALAKWYLSESHSLKDIQMSLATYELCSDLIERLQYGYKAERSKLSLGQQASRIYEKAIQTAVRFHATTADFAYLDKAFLFAEKSRASLLSASLLEAKAKPFANMADTLLQKEKQLKKDLSKLDTQLQKEYGKTQPASSKALQLEDTLFDLKREYEGLIARFETDYPEYYRLKYRTRTASLSEVQSRLPMGTALLEYVVGDSSLFTFAISRDGASVKQAEIESLTGLVKNLRRSLLNLDFEGYLATAHELYALLVAPSEPKLSQAKKLVVIPDGILNYLPFEALLTSSVSQSVQPDFAKLPYLIRDYEVSYHLSATLFLDAIETPTVGPALASKSVAGAAGESQTAGFVGMAPVFADSPRETLTAMRAALADTFRQDVYSSQTRSVMIDGQTFSALPHSETEVTGIADLFQEQNRTSRTYINDQSSERAIKSPAVAGSRYLHVATHGFINEANPKLSGLVFAQHGEAAEEDGVLYSGEIYNLDLNADLVVLSACESGLGKVVRGEGIMGLTRGFLYAGAKNVMVSLWQVADQSTSELMIEFYQNLLNGMRYSAALREAKLSLIREGKFAYPLEWSPFVLIGG